ncbi:hypothetical protein STEG23_008172, partial [Scotinomys teguina]
ANQALPRWKQEVPESEPFPCDCSLAYIQSEINPTGKGKSFQLDSHRPICGQGEQRVHRETPSSATLVD